MTAATHKTAEELLADAEPIILRMAVATARRGLLFEADDVAQELRLGVFRLAGKYDPARGIPWLCFVSRQIRNLAFNYCRKYGYWRQGRQRRPFFECSLDEDYEDGDPKIGAACPISEEELDLVEWEDAVRVAGSRDRVVNAAFLVASGLTKVAVARRFGVSESRVGQLLNRARPEQRQEILNLLGKDGPS